MTKKTYSEMTVNQLRHLASVNEKRIISSAKSVANKGLYSPAMWDYLNTRIPKNISKMNRGELYNTIYRQSDLRTKQTGTVKGTYEYINETRKTLLKDYNIKAKNREVGKLFKIYDQIAKNDPSIKSYKYETVKEISKKIKSGVTSDDILNNAERLKEQAYENKETNSFEDFTEL